MGGITLDNSDSTDDNEKPVTEYSIYSDINAHGGGTASGTTNSGSARWWASEKLKARE
jgi:hypothetical protein